MNLIDRLKGRLAGVGAGQPSAPKLSHSEQQALVQQLQSDRPAERWLAAEALRAHNLSAGALRALTAALAAPDPILRWEAAAALARSGAAGARQALLEAASQGRADAQAAALDGLAWLPVEPETLAALIGALDSEHAAVRQSAAETLARLTPPAAPDQSSPAPELQATLLAILDAEPEPFVRRGLVLALGRWGDATVSATLSALAQDEGEDAGVRAAAARALARLVTPAAAESSTPPAAQS